MSIETATGLETGQPYPYRRVELVEPDWTRFPGWRDVTAQEWASVQWQRAHCVKNVRQLRELLGDLLDERFYADLERDQAERATMRLQVTLDGPGDERFQVPVAVAVPERAQRRGRLEVLGGGWMWTDYWSSNDVDDIVKALNGAVRNDAVAAVLSFDSRRSSVTRRGESAPTEKVVYGRKRIDVRVR